MAQQTLVGQGLLIIGASHTHTHTYTHSLGLLWMSDQLVAERPLPDKTQHSQETDVHVPMPDTARPPGPAKTRH